MTWNNVGGYTDARIAVMHLAPDYFRWFMG
ncbi:Uncharacterised protein [Mycobacteroides abscessus subsp. bolletii]|uniref:Uncharacterized protein n=1 Tax=Mycobacteroides abscessus subsp. bolletii TaxID=319705 RepID=A0A9Q7WGV4_9MYCO|nr:Uncharacterised protein [Mycobacteroides abscessus]SHP14559.1 Uncharacterised protein [Mycobacteroides abscessus subsp. bolletii]SKT33813.1 Uncharacterised protein [Mycobacteroides abscessus subsp. abscessus]CPS45648.1 Uncharacterised protein [Mycobacteroides abscessus]CPW33892.1 Uncharacterised protein [Mycobacteroides abscessus]